MKSLFGNVVRIEEKSDNLIVVRFAIDRLLQYKDKVTGKYELGTFYVDLKFFRKHFDKFHESEIQTGSRLKIKDYDPGYWCDDYDPRNPKVSKISFLVNDFEKLQKQESSSLTEKPKTKIFLNKPIAQHKVEQNLEDEGNPSWMNE